MPLDIPRMPRLGARPISADPALEMRYTPAYLEEAEASRLFEQLGHDLKWHRERLVMFGRRRPVPRLVSWCGQPNTSYRYAGVTHRCVGWHGPLERLSRQLSSDLGVSFNFVLLNRYRSGLDHMGWHADDEPELGPQPVIASLSLGATRRFRVRPRHAAGRSEAVDLEHGSLLVAWGSSQQRYQHCLTRTRRPVGERINLTFRTVLD